MNPNNFDNRITVTRYKCANCGFVFDKDMPDGYLRYASECPKCSSNAVDVVPKGFSNEPTN